MTEGITQAEASKLISEWLPFTEGREFDIEHAQRQFNCTGVRDKHIIAQVLSTLKSQGKLDGERGRYRFVNTELEGLDWVEADTENILDIRWPYGWGDKTSFGFDDNLTLYPGSIVVVSGVSNQGKTAFMLNVLVLNLDDWECRYLTNEMGPEELKDRLSNFEEFYALTDELGSPRFEAAMRYDNYQDVILPNGLNIIDYLDPGENPYMVGQQIDAIRQKLVNGVAFIALQKKVTTSRGKDGTLKETISDYGTGGQYSEHRARIVLHIERDYLYVKKAKKCRKENLNGKKFEFDIGKNGSQFYNIRPYVEAGNG